MKKNSMRLLGFLLMAVMMVSLFAVGVFAGDTANDVNETASQPSETLTWKDGDVIDGITISKDVTINVSGTVTVNGTISLASDAICNVVFNGSENAKLIRGEGFTGQMFYAEGTSDNFQKLTFNNITLDGGAVWTGDVDKTLNRGTTNAGVKATGSVLYLVYANATLENGSVLQNHDDSTGEKANAVFLRYYSTFTVNDSVVRNNHSISTYYRGGVVTIRQGGTVKTNNADVYGNSGAAGGFVGISSTGAYGGIAEVKNSKFHNNYADNGAVFLMQCNSKIGYLSIDGCEFYENASKTAVLTEWAYSRPFIIKDSYFHDNECAVWDCNADPVLDLSGKIVVEEDADYTKYLFETPLVLSGALTDGSSIAISEASLTKLLSTKAYVVIGTADYAITDADLAKFVLPEGYKFLVADVNFDGIMDAVPVDVDFVVSQVTVTLKDSLDADASETRTVIAGLAYDYGTSSAHTGFAFTNWQKDDGKAVNAPIAVTSDSILILTAQWKLASPSVDVSVNGATLTATISNANEDIAYTYQWYIDGTAIDGATADTYTMTDLASHKYRCTVTASYEGYKSTSGKREVTASVPAAAQIGDVKYETLAEAIAAANAAENGATVTLLKDVTLGGKLTISGNVTIEGAYTITRADNYTGTLFTVNAGATLTLDGGLTIDGNNNYAFDADAFKADADNWNQSISKENSAKWFTPEAGKPVASAFMFTTTGGTINLLDVTVQNNYSVSSGVISAGANSTILMEGATVKHIASTQGNGVVANVSGANINVTVNEGTVIDGNHVGSNHGLFKIYSGAKLTMNGGEITNNTGWNSNGVAVGVYWGTFVMNGGSICSNVGVYGPNNGRNSAIYLHSGHNFEMNGGTICHNSGRARGGIDAPYDNGKAVINGGSVLDNVSRGNSDTYDVLGTSGMSINGGTFTQDVSKWLAPNTGLIHDEEKGVYTVTTAIWEMHLTDANGEAHWLSPMTGDTLASILSTSKIWYDSLQGGYSFTLKLLTDVKVDETGIVKFPLTIDLNGHTVTGVDVYPVIRVQEDATVTITGEGAIVNDDYVFVLGASDGTSAGYLTIENGKFYGETTVASVTKGTLTVNGGYFEATDENYDYAYTLNCVDANYKDGSAQIVVKGGTFYKFNPENNAAEGKGTDFVADSYKAVDNGDDTYTVKPVITVTFDDVTVVNGNAVPEFTYTTNFTELAGDGELLVVGTPVVEINGAGEYEITADAYVFMSDKYVVEVVPGTLTVVKPLVKANDGKNDLYFASIYDALNYIQPRETWTITVLEDFTITADQRMYTNYSIIINAEYITLDLNGKTITFDYTGSNKECLASIAIYNKGTLTIVDSSEEKTGTLYSKTLIQNSDGPRIIWVTSAGTATIEGGNFISEQANTMFYTSNSNKDIPTQMIINGGYFEHTVPTESGRYRYFNKQNGYQTQIIEVNGGVFAHDFRDSEMTFGEGLTAQQLPDGKWGVVGAVAEVVDAEGNRVGKWSYATVQDAINACTNGETVRLLTDITYGADDVVFAHGGATGFGNYDQYNPSIIYVGGTKGATAAENQPSKVNVVIDLNGHTITSNADAYLFLFMDNCQVTMKDSVGGGKVVNNSESYPAIWAVGAETLVTIQSGTYQTASPYGLIHATHSGDLVIEGGYFSTTADDASLLLMINSQKYNNPNYFLVGVATLTVKGGTFEGFDPAQVGDDYGASSIADIKFVNGCAEGFVSKDNGDGTYTVLPVITVTFGDATVINGNALPEFTYTTNFTELAGDGELLVVGTPVVEINGAGEYEITADAYVFMSDKYVVEVIPGTLTVQAAVASVNGTNYATLSAAIDAAKAGDTVTLLANVIEDVTFNKNLTLDGSSFKYTGTIKISGNANVTIKNFDFDGGIIIHKGTNNTAKLTVQKCSFTNANSYAVTTERINNVTIEDCTVTNQSLLYAKLTTTDVVVRRVTVEGGNYVAHLVYGTTALFESVTATKMTGYGIFTQNYGAKTITVKNCSFDTPKYNSIAINETRSTNSDTFIFEGDNVMTSIENHEYLKLVLAEGATLTAPEGLTVTTNVADYKVAYENGTYFLVAKDYVVEINGVKYESIQEAINAAQDGDVITVIADHELTEIIKSADKFAYPVLVDVEKKVTIDLNGKTVTVNNPVADTKYSQFDLIAAIYVGGNGDLTLKDSVGGGNLTVTAGDSQIYTLLMVDGENTKMLIESGHYELDKTANQSLIYAGDDKTITVTGGTFVLLNANPDISKIPWIFNCYGDGVNSVTVTGGTYNVDPTHYHGEVYYPKGYMAVENADGTWSVVKGKVYNETYGVTYMTIADAMAHAMTTTGKGDDVIVLLENHTESVVLVYDGTVLDVKDKTLTADYLVVFKGGFVTGNAYDKDGAHGQIKINKDRVVITEGALAQGQGYMMPVWNEDHYVFGLIGAITSGGSYGCTYNEETDEVELSFKVKATTDLNNDIMKLKGYSDHGLKVVVRVEWMVDLTGDGVADALQSRNYVYTDEMVQACAGKKMYVFSIGVGDRQNMRVVVDVVSDTGASLSSTEYVFNN